MHLADIAGLNVPLNGLVYSRDGSLTYFIRRFDRAGKARKLATEDFAPLSGRDRDTKYSFSIEKVTALLEKHCTFPLVERAKLFRRSLFSFLIGNEDMHLKNFSLVRRNDMIELSPLYDCPNTIIAMQAMGKVLEEIEELALPLRGRKQKLIRKDWIEYFGRDTLQLTGKVMDDCLQRFITSVPKWHDLITISFVSDSMKTLYSELLQQRCAVLEL